MTTTSSATSISSLTSLGVGSGIDLETLLTKILEVEKQPLATLTSKQTSYNTKLSAYGTVKSALSTFQSAFSTLKSAATFQANKTTLSTSSYLSATASTSASAGSYNIKVTTLAQSHSVASSAYTSEDSSISSAGGTLTFEFGSTSTGSFVNNASKATKTVNISSTDGTLSGIRDAVNNAGIGVTASITNDGTGYRLTFTSNDGGTNNTLKISTTNTSGTALDVLAYDPTSTSTTITQQQAGVDAVLSINGLSLTKPNNIITDAIPGVTLTLNNTSTTASTTLTVAKDTSTITSAIQSFVTAYNTATSSISALTKYDTTTSTASTLTGDSTVRSIQSQLRSTLTTALGSAGGGLTMLSDIGITFGSDGTLSLNSTTLATALADTTKDVSTLFASVGKPSDSQVKYTSSTSSTIAGSYAVNITQLATRGSATTSALASDSNVITSSNNTLSISVDGTSVSVTIPVGTYTRSNLAVAVQAAVNGSSSLSSLSSSISASVNGSNALVLTSTRYGSASKVSIDSSTFATAFLGTSSSTDGVDVLGTINGETALGAGQSLTSTTGNAIGLKLQITGGSTGSRGTVSFDNGFASRMDTLITNMTSSTGILQNKTDGINSTLEKISTDIENFNTHLSALEATYRAQFANLDTLLASMQATSTYLTQQFKAMTSSSS